MSNVAGKSWLWGAAVLAVVCGWFVYRHVAGSGYPIRNVPPGEGPIVCFGDSLVAGVGADSAEGTYPACLQRMLGRSVVTFGFPGATAEEGWGRLRRKSAIRGSIVIVTLGGNDILRKVPVEDTCRWLRKIFAELQERGAVVVYAGVAGVFSGERTRRCRTLCRETGVLFVPNVLRGILGRNDLKSDTVHPNDKGYRIMAQGVADALTKSGLLTPSS